MCRWAITWLPPELRGGVPHGECADVSMELGLEIEYSLLSDTDLFGAQLDESKAYDSVVRDLPFQTAVRLGLEEDFVDI